MTDTDIIHSMLCAAWHSRRPVRDEVAHSIEHYAKYGSETNSYGRRMRENKGRVLELTLRYASLRGELGALPVFRDTTAVCEASVSRWAARLQEEVEQRAWESLRSAENG